MIEKYKNLGDQGIVLLFLIALVGYMPTARSSDRIVWVGALALLLVRTLWLFARREVRFSMDVNLFLYILMFLWGLLSCVWSEKISEFRTYGTVAFPAVLCAVFCLSSHIGQRISPERFLWLLVLSGLAGGIRYCCYTDWSSLSEQYYLRGSFGGLLDDVTNYNNYTMILSTSCVVALYLAIVARRPRAILPAVALVAILLVGGSRKNIVAIPLIALLFSLFTGNGEKKLRALLLFLGGLIVGIYLLETLPALAQIRKAMEGMLQGLGRGETVTVDASTRQRMDLMKQGIRVWMEHPIGGVGWNNYRYYNDAGLYAHNSYIELLASLGIVGFLLYYAMFFRIAYLLGTTFLHHRAGKADVLLLGVCANVLLTEWGSITLYFKERLIVMLVIFYWHSYVTCRKTYRFLLR